MCDGICPSIVTGNTMFFFLIFLNDVSRVTDVSVAGTTPSGNEREHVFGTNLSILFPRLRLGGPGEGLWFEI